MYSQNELHKLKLEIVLDMKLLANDRSSDTYSISIVGNSFAQSLGSMEFFSGLKYDGAFADLSDSLST